MFVVSLFVTLNICCRVGFAKLQAFLFQETAFQKWPDKQLPKK